MVFLGKKVSLALTLSTQWCEKVADNCLGYLKNLWGGGGEGGGGQCIKFASHSRRGEW